MLAGLSKCDIVSTPPDFCATAVGAVLTASHNAPAAANPLGGHFISVYLPPSSGFARDPRTPEDPCCTRSFAEARAAIADAAGYNLVAERAIARRQAGGARSVEPLI
jgi:hypothetical protein